MKHGGERVCCGTIVLGTAGLRLAMSNTTANVQREFCATVDVIKIIANSITVFYLSKMVLKVHLSTFPLPGIKYHILLTICLPLFGSTPCTRY